MTSEKLRSRVAEIAIVFGGINLFILVLALLYIAITWSIHLFATNPIAVIAAWSSGFMVISVIVLGIVLWLSREPEEEKEEDVE